MTYLFNSRILTHISFWLGYFLLFGFIWTRDGNYSSSYFLEFVLLPIRIGVVYASLYYLLPRYLLKKKFALFLVSYSGLLLFGSILQRFFIHFFYEQQTNFDLINILDPAAVLRAFILINSTALFLLALKILFLYLEERSINQPIHDEKIEVKSDKRFYRIHPSDILYLEGLGNYVTYYLRNGTKIIGYNSLKNANNELPDYFVRIHKSFIVNTNQVISYDKHNVEIAKEKFLPIGNSYEFEI
ncbi:LytR/AlgR family response regulator transcription factor [Ekhidna sp.]